MEGIQSAQYLVTPRGNWSKQLMVGSFCPLCLSLKTSKVEIVEVKSVPPWSIQDLGRVVIVDDGGE